MKISVLMSAYNAEKYLQYAIESIKEQTYSSWELLICDDGSIDSTYDIAKKHESSYVKVYKNETNKGKPLSVNKLYSLSSGDLITIHDADDISLPERFKLMAETFANTDVFVCGHIIERMTEEGKPLGLYRDKVVDPNEILHHMETDNTDGDPSLFFRREVVESLNGQLLRSYFPNNMDYDMALRMIEKYKFTNILQVLSYYRNVPNSISKGITNYKKLTTQKMTQFFYRQRKSKGTDALMDGDWDLIKEKENDFSEVYRKDKTLFLREMAAFYMYTKMNREAIKNSLIAIKMEPHKLINWRILQYCLRKSIIGV